MKKLLLLPVLIVALLALAYGAAVLIDNHYQDHQKQKEAQAPKTVPLTQFQALENTTIGELQSLQADNSRLLGECQKGAAAYAKLTPVLKNQTPVPTCTAPAQ